MAHEGHSKDLSLSLQTPSSVIVFPLSVQLSRASEMLGSVHCHTVLRGMQVSSSVSPDFPFPAHLGNFKSDILSISVWFPQWILCSHNRVTRSIKGSRVSGRPDTCSPTLRHRVPEWRWNRPRKGRVDNDPLCWAATFLMIKALWLTTATSLLTHEITRLKD